MTLLLDTHVLVWWLIDAPALGDQARAAIADARHGVWVSAASAWEMAIKSALGRLQLPGPVAEVVSAVLAENAFTPLPVSVDHAVRVTDLPPVHATRSTASSSPRPSPSA